MSSGRRVLITGVGVISPLGDTPEGLHQALCEGEVALAPPSLFSTEGLKVSLAAEVPGFSAREYLGEGNLRPLDRTAQLAASAARRALEAAGVDPEARRRRQAGLVLGTVFGSVRTISEFDRRALEAGPVYAKPLDFANSVINAAAGQTAIWHGLTGINSTLCAGSGSGLHALAYATDLIAGGRAEMLLAGGAEELCFESFLGFQRSGRVAGSRNGSAPRAVPFAAGRNGFLLGEGAALLVLESEASAVERCAPVLGEVLGHANGFDPSRGSDPHRAARTLSRAVAAALAAAELRPADLAAVSASANGGEASDAHEAGGLCEALGEAAAAVPVTAVKGQLGEGLGAGGALQAVCLLEALRRRRLPGIVGLDEPDPALAPVRFARAAETLPAGAGLATALSFDGHCCAVVLGRGAATD